LNLGCIIIIIFVFEQKLLGLPLTWIYTGYTDFHFVLYIKYITWPKAFLNMAAEPDSA